MACRLFIETNDGILSIGPLGINFSVISIEMQNLPFRKLHWKVSSTEIVAIVSLPQCVIKRFDIIAATLYSYLHDNDNLLCHQWRRIWHNGCSGFQCLSTKTTYNICGMYTDKKSSLSYRIFHCSFVGCMIGFGVLAIIAGIIILRKNFVFVDEDKRNLWVQYSRTHSHSHSHFLLLSVSLSLSHSLFLSLYLYLSTSPSSSISRDHFPPTY